MADLSKTSSRETSPDTIRSTSSQESEDGARHSGLPGGLTTDLFGQPVAPAPRSRPPERKRSVQIAKRAILCGMLDELATQYASLAATRGLPMPATYGQKPGDLSQSAARRESTASRLMALVDSNGSLEYRLRWKSSVTLLGSRYYRLRASARPIHDTEFSGWPTPDAAAMNVGCDPEAHLSRLEELRERGINGNGAGMTLGAAAQLAIAGWPTPKAERPDADTTFARGNPTLAKAAGSVVGWCSPTARDSSRGSLPPRDHDSGVPLSQQVQMMVVHGTTSISSHAEPETDESSRGALAPEFTCWLMGYPPEVNDCAPSGTR